MKRPYSLIAPALTISLFIYLFYRSERTIVNQLAALILSENLYEDVRLAINRFLTLNEAIVFSLPGGLWVFCTTVLARDLYFSIENHKIRLLHTPIFFAVGLELCQLFHFTNGTFDARDLGFYLGSWLVGVYAYRSRNTHQDILAPFSLNSLACMACFLSVYLAHVSQ